MSKLRSAFQLAQELGLSTEKAATLSPETISQLRKVDNPWAVSKLTGEEAAAHDKALTEAFGPKDQRRWEGTKKQIQFSPQGEYRDAQLRKAYDGEMLKESPDFDKLKDLGENIKINEQNHIKVTRGGGERNADAMFDPRWKNVTDKNTMMAGVAAVPGMTAENFNPADALKSLYGKFEEGRDKVAEGLSKAVTGFLPEASKAPAQQQAKAIMNAATDPLSYAGGAGMVDAAVGVAGAIPEGTSNLIKVLKGTPNPQEGSAEEKKKRFGLFD